MSASTNSNVSWKSARSRSIKGGDVTFAYRELGTHNAGVPLICLTHLAAVLDNWDPRVIDGFAAKHHVVAFDNRGIGASSGSPADSIEDMARDAITFIKAMGFSQVDLFGFSMGRMIAQEIALMEPQLIRKMILTGTGPAGGEGISKVGRVTYYDMLRGYLTFQDPKQFLFFTRTPRGIEAGKEFLARLKERSETRDKEITVGALLAQLKALRRWGSKKPADLSIVRHPVLVANGDDDRMVPTKNSHDLARRLPNSELVIYPDAGHGGVFQFHADFVQKALVFLARPTPKPDEILVQVHAVGLNPVDLMIPTGTFKPFLKFNLPATLGSDLAGVVIEVGSQVTRFRPGDAVFASTFDSVVGSLAEFAVVREIAAARKPTNLDFAQAASIPMVGLTSWQALKERAKVAPRAKSSSD